jgi:hypothetical protein
MFKHSFFNKVTTRYQQYVYVKADVYRIGIYCDEQWFVDIPHCTLHLFQFSTNNCASWPLAEVQSRTSSSLSSSTNVNVTAAVVATTNVPLLVEWYVPADSLIVYVITSNSKNARVTWPSPASIPSSACNLQFYNNPSLSSSTTLTTSTSTTTSTSSTTTSTSTTSTTNLLAPTPSLVQNAHLLPQLITQFATLYHRLSELERTLSTMYAILPSRMIAITTIHDTVVHQMEQFETQLQEIHDLFQLGIHLSDIASFQGSSETQSLLLPEVRVVLQ